MEQVNTPYVNLEPNLNPLPKEGSGRDMPTKDNLEINLEQFKVVDQHPCIEPLNIVYCIFHISQ